MAGLDSHATEFPEGLDDSLGAPAVPQRTNVLTHRLNNVLSASFADSDIRDVLRALDGNKVTNTAETRRTIRLNVQKGVIERNGAIIKDFRPIVEVCLVQRFDCCR